MLSFVMRQQGCDAVGRKLLDRLAWMSHVLVEIEDWLDSRTSSAAPARSERVGRRVTLETLDWAIARDRGRL